MPSFSLIPLDFNIGDSNGSGIADVYVAPKQWISAWPTIDDDLSTATSVDSYTSYTGNFTMIDNKHLFIPAYQVQGEGEGNSDAIGERDSKMFQNKVKFRFPKLTAANLALQKAIVNGDVVVVFWHDGAYRIVGHKYYRADANPTTTTGAAAGSAKGTTYEVICPDFAVLPIYSGMLPLVDGRILNCATGEFTPAS